MSGWDQRHDLDLDDDRGRLWVRLVVSALVVLVAVAVWVLTS